MPITKTPTATRIIGIVPMMRRKRWNRRQLLLVRQLNPAMWAAGPVHRCPGLRSRAPADRPPTIGEPPIPECLGRRHEGRRLAAPPERPL